MGIDRIGVGSVQGGVCVSVCVASLGQKGKGKKV
jgi:hypothetical protein